MEEMVRSCIAARKHYSTARYEEAEGGRSEIISIQSCGLWELDATTFGFSNPIPTHRKNSTNLFSTT